MEITQDFIDRMNQNSLYRSLGLRVEGAQAGEARVVLEPDPKHCWPFSGQPHGGILFTLMDVTMAWAVLSDIDPGYNCATINLDIQYTRPARGDTYFGTAQTSHRTGRLCFVRSEIHDQEDQLLAMGQGTYRVVDSGSMQP
jgi:uncharacterized protein (TIGR00369 family)